MAASSFGIGEFRAGYANRYASVDAKGVTKRQFKETYVKLGGGVVTGWGPEYWNKFFEDEERPGMKYLLEEPETSEHTRMMIVTDCGRNEYRLFFLTEESEESLFEFPDER